MRGWLLFNSNVSEDAPEGHEILRFLESARRRGIQLDVLKPRDFELIVSTERDWRAEYAGGKLPRPDFIIPRTGSETTYFTLAVLRQFQRMGVAMINGPDAVEACADKLQTLQLLSASGLPIPRTILAKFPVDVDVIEKELGFPVVVKTLRSTRGAGVVLCQDREQFDNLASLLGDSSPSADFIFQKYIRSSHGRDVRLLVIGGKVAAAMERRSRNGGFKSNISLGGVAASMTPPPEMADLALKAAEALRLDIAGIDILYDERGYRICEANSSPGFVGLEGACRAGQGLRLCLDASLAACRSAQAVYLEQARQPRDAAREGKGLVAPYRPVSHSAMRYREDRHAALSRSSPCLGSCPRGARARRQAGACEDREPQRARPGRHRGLYAGRL